MQRLHLLRLRIQFAFDLLVFGRQRDFAELAIAEFERMHALRFEFWVENRVFFGIQLLV